MDTILPEALMQGSEEWKQYRCGKISASRVAGILPGRSGYKASRKDYMAELVCERITGTWAERFVSGPMQWGTETEPLARSAFEALEGKFVVEHGFKDHPYIKDFGSSPDGLVLGDDGFDSGLEIKCPKSATHINTLRTGAIKPEYIIQMHVGMMCYKLPAWWFVSFDPRMPEGLQYYAILIGRDEALCSKIEMEVRKFLAELEAMTTELQEMIK